MVSTDDGQPVKSFAASTVVTLGKRKHRKLSTVLILCSCIMTGVKMRPTWNTKKVLNSLYSNLVFLVGL